MSDKDIDDKDKDLIMDLDMKVKSSIFDDSDSLIIKDDLNEDEEPASILVEDSLAGISDIKPEDIIPKVSKVEDHLNEFNVWLFVSITILVGFMLFGSLIGLDLLIGLNCQEIGCNCGHPVIANALYELIYGG
tara:strand:+ start:527 stop:925 length:399 start_codon:yes stop_codon:yes gene_type:complete